MSTPNKPLPGEIYARRRLAALLTILVVVAVLFGLWFLLRGDDPQQTQSTGASSAAAASSASAASGAGSVAPQPSGASGASVAPAPAEASAEPETEPAGEAPPAETTSAVAAEAPKPTCELNDLVIGAAVDQPTYAAGEQPQFTMTVVNPTAADCVINLDEQTLRFEVYDMGTNQLVWNDTDCSLPVKSGIQTFKAGAERDFSAKWSRLGSAPGQCTNRQLLRPDAYFLHAVIGNHASEAQPFNLY